MTLCIERREPREEVLILLDLLSAAIGPTNPGGIQHKGQPWSIAHLCHTSHNHMATAPNQQTGGLRNRNQSRTSARGNQQPRRAAPVTHTQTRTWVNPDVRLRKDLQLLQQNRAYFCPRSDILTEDFDLRGHQIAFAADQKKEREESHKRRLARSSRGSGRDRTTGPTVVKKSFVDRKPDMFRSILSPVLCVPTAFVPYLEKPGRVGGFADWPDLAEMKYEGDERLATEFIHSRTLAAPRSRGNETVNWMQRPIVQPFPLDNFHYPPPSEVDIFMRSHIIRDIEPNDHEGAEAIGKDLMDILDS